MTDAQRRRLEQQRESLLARLHALPNLMRGSLYERLRKCGRASCTCAQGGPRHRGRQLTVTLRGATHTRYVRQEEVAELQQLLATYAELCKGGRSAVITVISAEPPSKEGRRWRSWHLPRGGDVGCLR